ncbi:MAG: hypothetical protein JNK45_08370 [Myxococcales bacterium]|nr:hypothetical protein [Myxococcales bacterium]
MWIEVSSSVSATVFAPSAESVTLTTPWTAKPGHTFRAMKLRVKDAAGTLVFESPPLVVGLPITWDGSRNQPLGAAGFMSPCDSPYTLELLADQTRVPGRKAKLSSAFDSVVTKCRTFAPIAAVVGPPRVAVHSTVAMRYHSVALSKGEWLPAEEVARLDGIMNPLAGAAFAHANLLHADTVTWVWYKLGTLGYFPGALPAPPRALSGNELGKAIRRYRQVHPDLYRRLFHRPNTDNDHEQDDAAADLATTIDAPLLVQLHADANDRLRTGTQRRVVVNSGVFDGSDATSRLYVDVDRFYIGTGAEFEGDLKAQVDAAWVPRPHIALRATVLLEGIGGGPVAATHHSALGDYRVRWSWTDRAEDTSALPSYAADRPNRTREYVNAAKAAIPASTGIATTRHNTFATFGGVVSADADATATAVFAACPPFRDASVVGEVGTQSDTTPNPSTASFTQVFFRPSNIAGDNFTVSATLDQGGWSVGVQVAHAGRVGLQASTGEFEIWRRITLAAYVDWGGNVVPSWKRIRRKFSRAFVHVSGPDLTWNLSLGPPPTAYATALEHAVNTGMFNAPTFPTGNTANRGVLGAATKYRFSATAMFPEDPRSVEFQDLMAIGVGQFADPTNIINEMMVMLAAPLLRLWRSADPPRPADVPRAQDLMPRYRMATLWAASGTAWVAAVGAHFVNELNRLLAVPHGAPAHVLAVAFPPDRTIRPIAAATVNAPGGVPASRAGIVEALLVDVLTNELADFGSRTPLTSQRTENLKAVIGFVARLRRDVADADRNLAGADPSKVQLVHPLLRVAIPLYFDYYTKKIASAFNVGSGAVTLKTHDAEVLLVPDLSTAIAVQDLLATALAHLGVAASPPLALGVLGGTQVQTFDQRRYKIMGDFDPTHLVGNGPNQVPAASCSVTVLRGHHAAPPPRIPVSPADEARMDVFHREEWVGMERALVDKRLDAQDFFNDIHLRLCMPLHDAVHHTAMPNRPGAGIIVCQYRAHPRPLPITTGTGEDIVDHTNSTSMGFDGGMVFVSGDQPLPSEHLFSHEIAHVLFLRHWQYMEETIRSGWSRTTDHDLADSNCVMSYSAFTSGFCESHFRASNYRPNFCGKCNLKLRGWDISALYHGAPCLPAQSVPLTPVFPLVAGATPVTTELPDLTQLHTVFTQFVADLDRPLTGAPHAPTTNQQVCLYGTTALQVNAGTTRYRCTPLAGAIQRPSGAPLAPTTVVFEHEPSPAPIADAVLLTSPNRHHKSGWEQNVLYHHAKGGTTARFAHIKLVTTSRDYYGEPTLIHELQHYYQVWEGSLLQEGIIELFAHITGQAFTGAHAVGPAFDYEFNPSYIVVTQVVIDELLPRLGIRGLARLLFYDAGPLQSPPTTDFADESILRPILLPSVTPGDFNAMCRSGIDDYDMSRAVALLLPIDDCRPVLAPNTTPGGVRCAQLQGYLVAAVQAFSDFLRDNNPLTHGVLAPPPVAAADRAKVAQLIRIKMKGRIYHLLLAEARGYRAAEINNRQHRVHRLEPYIEESRKELSVIRRMYAEWGGSVLDIPPP